MLKQLTPHVYVIPSRFGYVNMYLIINSEQLTLIDTGLAGDADLIENVLQEAGYTWEHVQHILITHAHPDHIGALAAVQQRTNAHTYVHRLDAPVTRGEDAQVLANPDSLSGLDKFMYSMVSNAPQTQPARVDTGLQDGDTLDAIINGLQVVRLAGHSYGQVGYYLPDEGILIAGDVVMNLPFGITKPFRFVSPDWDAVHESIQRVIDLNPQILALGHGAPIQGNVATCLQKFVH